VSKFVSQFFYLLGPESRKLPFLILIFLSASMLDLLGLSLVGPYVALVVAPEPPDSVLLEILVKAGIPQEHQILATTLGLALFAVFGIKAIAAIGIHWAIIRFSQRQQLRLRSYLMQNYQAMPYADYLRRNSSEYIFNIQVLAGEFSDIVRAFLRVICDGIVAVVIICLLAVTNVLALLLLVGVLGSVIVGYDRLFRKRMTEYGLQHNIANTRLIQGAQEGVTGFKEVRVFGCQDYFLKKVQDNARRAKYYQERKLVTQQAPWYLFEWTIVTFIVLLVIGAPLLGGDMNSLVPTLGIFGVAGLRLVSLANTLSTSLVLLRFSKEKLTRLCDDLRVLDELGTPKLNVSQESAANSLNSELSTEKFQLLTIRDLSYRYPKARVNALNGISMEVFSGESIGVVGRSGAGKTTLVDVLLGLLEPETESITFNNRPLQSKLKEWHSQVAYLPQEVFLMDDTLKRNVALGVLDSAIDEVLLRDALIRARLDEVVQHLPSGIDTTIGEDGARLSGGQRQRVALARAFYHQRSVLVMDESTSALDNETEKEIIEEIKILKGEITLIVIAHRFTTVEHCDRIYRLEHGRVVSHGRPEDVLSPIR